MRNRRLLAAAKRALSRRSIATSTRKLIAETATAEIRARLGVGRRATSVEAPREAERGLAPIDIVYTWVDDADPAWRTSRAATRDALREPADRDDDAARYRNYDELRYSLRTVASFAPWVRKIHVVTAGQAPPWLAPDDVLGLVDHRQILPAEALPTFNSHAIEARLHHIPDLARHFVYFNDDFFLGRPTGRTLFFELDSMRPRVFLDDGEAPDDDALPPGMYRAARTTADLVERLTGRTDRRMLLHAPYALDCAILGELERLLSEELEAVVRHRFRHPDDISVAASLAPKFALATGRAVASNADVEYVSLAHALAGTRMRRLWRTRRFEAFCLNSSDLDPTEGLEARWVQRWMERLAPTPSQWER